LKIVKTFNTWIKDDKIFITSNYNKKLIVRFREKYTGLSVYKTETEFVNGVEYWYKIGPRFEIINGVWIEIYDGEELLHKESYDFGENIKIQLHEQIHYDKNDTNSWSTFFEVFIKNSYESDLVKFEKDDVVVDLGANIGMFTLFASNKVKKVYSIEPLPDTYECLVKNTKKLENVITLNKAIYSTEKEMEFIQNEISISSSFFRKKPNSETIKVKTIKFDNMLKEHNISRVNYLKVDIEGAEFDLFENINEDYLQNNIDKIFMEVHIMNDNFKLEHIISKIDKYFHYNIESENVDTYDIKHYLISCLNKNKK